MNKNEAYGRVGKKRLIRRAMSGRGKTIEVDVGEENEEGRDRKGW